MTGDVKIISVLRAKDDSGWHVRFVIEGIEYPAVWIASEGYLDREWLKDLLAEKMGFKRPSTVSVGPEIEAKATTIYVDTSILAAAAAPPPPAPPRIAELVFAWLAPAKSVHAQLGDMQEMFERNLARFGRHRAQWFYWVQVLRAVGPNLWRHIKKWGVIGILIDYGRSKLGF